MKVVGAIGRRGYSHSCIKEEMDQQIGDHKTEEETKTKKRVHDLLLFGRIPK